MEVEGALVSQWVLREGIAAGKGLGEGGVVMRMVLRMSARGEGGLDLADIWCAQNGRGEGARRVFKIPRFYFGQNAGTASWCLRLHECLLRRLLLKTRSAWRWGAS